eukprot:SM000011S19050  [mRNA]  locus=s11:509502:515891:- [translate_table: standard]
MQVDHSLSKLQSEVSAQDYEHKKTLTELEKGVDVLFHNFGRLDTRISGVSQTAARIGDHLQSADSEREAACQLIESIKYLMDFNNSPGDLLRLAPVFSDDKRVAEAAALSQKLRSFAEEDSTSLQLAGEGRVKGVAVASPGLEVAVGNLQDYCNELENRLLAKFDAASQRRELATMAQCAKILNQFNRGTSAMHRYVASRPMFMDFDIVNSDYRMAIGDTVGAANAGFHNPARGLSTLYKEIVETVKKEATTVAAVFPSPDIVMSLLVSRILEQRIYNVLDKMLPDYQQQEAQGFDFLTYLRTLAAAYERTQELARELKSLGCGELDVEGLAESLFSSHLKTYHQRELNSLQQLFDLKNIELKAEALHGGSLIRGARARGGLGPAGLSSGAQPALSVGVVSEFVRWNEEAVARSLLLIHEPTALADSVEIVFGTVLDQVREYATAGLQAAEQELHQAAIQRDKFTLGTSVSWRVQAAAIAAVMPAEGAAAAGENSVRAFMMAVHRATTIMSMVQQHFTNTIARHLIAKPGAHATCIEEMGLSMADAEQGALRGLQLCVDTIVAEVDRLLQTEQKVADFKPPEDGNIPDHRPTKACSAVVAYVGRTLDVGQGSLEGPNKLAFMAEVGDRLHKCIIVHIQRFTLSPSGGLRLKRDVTEYTELVRSFKAPQIDEKLETLGQLVNLFIVAPESLPMLLEGSRIDPKDAARYMPLREDYKSAKIANLFAALIAE